MPGLVPAIHVLFFAPARKTWMAGTSPAVTKKRFIFNLLAEVGKCWLLFQSGSEEARKRRLEG
jgi:hypothetical protein